MKSKLVGFSESQEYIDPETFLKRWIKIWHEVEVEAGDDPDACYRYAEEKVNKWRVREELIDAEAIRWPVIGHPTISTGAIPVYDKKSEQTEIAIDNATSLHELDLLIGDAAKYNLAKQLNERRKKLIGEKSVDEQIK